MLDTTSVGWLRTLSTTTLTGMLKSIWKEMDTLGTSDSPRWRELSHESRVLDGILEARLLKLEQS